jgi:pantothenate kinase
MEPSLGLLIDRVHGLRPGPGRRVMIGIAGSPGAGKTTLAQQLTQALVAQLGPELVAYLPMDGFHLADVELERLGLLGLKGTPQSFDAAGYVALLQRVRANSDVDAIIYAPAFDRTLEQPIAGSIPVHRSAQVVITEGNYLLLPGAWHPVKGLLDEIWFCRTDETVRLRRLLERHVRFGKSPQFAQEWMDRVDRPNSELIEAGSPAATLSVELD